VLFKKCTGCKREYEKDELEEMQSKHKLLKNTCPDCHKLLKTYDESRFQKKWYGYLNSDKRLIDHLVLVEFKYYDDDSFEVVVPLLDISFETKDFSEAINIPDKNISIDLKDKYEKAYDCEHKFLTIAFKKETATERQNVTAWW
jgi:hypothetical protein